MTYIPTPYGTVASHKASASGRSSMIKGQPLVRRYRRIGRNDLCPCGSGKKFKKCCIERLK